jgi:hypothetical protein
MLGRSVGHRDPEVGVDLRLQPSVRLGENVPHIAQSFYQAADLLSGDRCVLLAIGHLQGGETLALHFGNPR